MRNAAVARPPALSPPASEFNALLFAPIGEESNHRVVTVLSARRAALSRIVLLVFLAMLGGLIFFAVVNPVHAAAPATMAASAPLKNPWPWRSPHECL